MQYRLTIAIIFTMASLLQGQQDISGFFMGDTYQRTHYNPAFVDSKKISIGLANTSFGVLSTANNPLKNGVTNADGELVISLADIERDGTDFFSGLQLGTLEVGLRFGDSWSVNLGHMGHVATASTLSEDLINVALDGNAPYIGQTLELNPDVGLIIYQEVYAGVGYHTESFSGGLRLGLISGVQSVDTERSQINLTTNEEYYQLEFDNDYLVNTVAGVDYDGLDDVDAAFENSSFGEHTGLSIDLGAAYRVNDQLELSASVLDIGAINWGEGAQQFSSSGSFSYDGIDIAQYIDEDLEIELTDSLSDLLQIEETSTSYSSGLPTTAVIGATYRWNDKLTLGGVLMRRNNLGRGFTLWGVNATTHLFKVLNLGATYSYKPGNPVNLGVNLGLDLGPVQLLFATDNILGFDVQQSSHVTGRFGLGIRFGRLADNVSTEE